MRTSARFRSNEWGGTGRRARSAVALVLSGTLTAGASTRTARPTLEMVRGSDASNERSATIAVRLRNETQSTVTVYFRRALLSFEVSGPQGKATCTADDESRHPVRRAFVTLRPGGSRTLVTRLVEVCPRGTFAKAGLYTVGAEFTTNVDGSEVGLHAFTGTLRAPHPVTVRVRHAIRLFPSRPVIRPTKAAPPAPSAAPPPPPPRKAAPPVPRAVPPAPRPPVVPKK